ncbi:MAG: TIM barrel protein [Nocardioides sp.]|uniref:hydroxypyruvate isomerase family protein n=1 Tax=Nocardioides sp. TaxID=35761 RepID=UPI0039E6256E
MTSDRVAANISMLFGELPFLERPRAAAEAGFAAVEFWWPFSRPIPHQLETRELAEAIRGAGVRVALMNLDVGPEAGSNGMVSIARHRDQFVANLEAALPVIEQLRVPVVSVPFGNVDPLSTVPAQRAVAIEGLALAVDAAATVGATVVVEALNNVANPNVVLSRTSEVAGLLDELRVTTGRRAKVQFDAYHAAMMGEDPLAELVSILPSLGHVQLADHPGRHEPGSGSLDWKALLRLLTESGYDGTVGFEYEPAADTWAGLSWLDDMASLSGGQER